MYVCNCNGLRKRDVASSIEAGAQRPRDIFASHQCQAQCAKCVCEMRQMIDDSRQAFAMAAGNAPHSQNQLRSIFTRKINVLKSTRK